jgi:polyisoprenyl-teichoic acid--peptidoglycan teichoic acid transferase
MEGGAELAAATVTENFEGVTIDRYVRVDTDAFKELVDLLGGVEVYVPTRMKYTDNTQKLHIDLQPGLQVLDGDQAEQFARFRKDATGDIGRVQRQQQLIRALRERVANPTIIPKIPQIIELLKSHIDTNMSMEEMLALANFGLQLERDNFQMVLLPGRFSRPDESIASYWILNPEGKERLMQQFFGVASSGSTDEEVADINRLSIAVQNATGSPEMGQQVARYLREQGFRRVYVVRDWSEVLPQTEVITQNGDLDSARRLQTMLQLGQVIPASTGDLDSDVTLRVGEDWLELHSQK